MSRSTSRLIILYTGQSGSGKTYLAEQFLGLYPRPVIVIDSMNEWGEYGRTYRDLTAMYQDVGRLLAGTIDERPPGDIFRLKAETIELAEAALHVAHSQQIPGSYIVDEAHRLAPSNQRSDLQRMVQTGRHASQSLIVTTQRPQDIHNHLPEEAVICCFRQSVRGAEHAARYLQNGLQADALQRLDQYEYVVGGRRSETLQRFGDPDGSVWSYNPETAKVEPVRDAP
jgi:hypothetical protein